GIGIFIAAMKACKQNGCAKKKKKLSPRVERLFRITGLYEHIAVRKGESE
ncbi:anti-sigma B factor antagonist, partial [Mesorhizobium sp. M00.F.Ca.ET.186.01.1.1]